jgi:hypothetical protein
VLFDWSTQKWEMLGRLNSNYLTCSSDSEAVYFDTILEKDPAFYRLRIRDRKPERVVSLKDIRRPSWPLGAWSGITPDNFPLVLRDTGTQEIYALDVDFP